MNWYNSYGFELGVMPPLPDYLFGPITGQGFYETARPPGWLGWQTGGGIIPNVIPDPTGFGMGQVVEFFTNAQGDQSVMDILFYSPLKYGNTIVEIEFEIFRTELNVNNFWWWTPDAGDFTYGLEWDQSLAVHPFGWSPGAGSTPASVGAWDHVALEWDYANQVVNSWVNGIAVDVNLPFGANPPADVTGFTFNFAHDGGADPQQTLAYIDNFHVTVDHTSVPEPGVFAMLGAGLVGLLGYLRRKR